MRVLDNKVFVTDTQCKHEDHFHGNYYDWESNTDQYSVFHSYPAFNNANTASMRIYETTATLNIGCLNPVRLETLEVCFSILLEDEKRQSGDSLTYLSRR